ncbi:hypothetical protein ACJX0J_041813, partial [Zea mays]
QVSPHPRPFSFSPLLSGPPLGRALVYLLRHHRGNSMKPQIVKQVLLELRPRLSDEKLLVSIAVRTKMQDLQ